MSLLLSLRLFALQKSTSLIRGRLFAAVSYTYKFDVSAKNTVPCTHINIPKAPSDEGAVSEAD